MGLDGAKMQKRNMFTHWCFVFDSTTLSVWVALDAAYRLEPRRRRASRADLGLATELAPGAQALNLKLT